MSVCEGSERRGSYRVVEGVVVTLAKYIFNYRYYLFTFCVPLMMSTTDEALNQKAFLEM